MKFLEFPFLENWISWIHSELSQSLASRGTLRPRTRLAPGIPTSTTHWTNDKAPTLRSCKIEIDLMTLSRLKAHKYLAVACMASEQWFAIEQFGQFVLICWMCSNYRYKAHNSSCESPWSRRGDHPARADNWRQLAATGRQLADNWQTTGRQLAATGRHLAGGGAKKLSDTKGS